MYLASAFDKISVDSFVIRGEMFLRRTRCLEQLRRLEAGSVRQLSTSTPAPSPRSAYDLDEAPLFSLRTRILFFTAVGGTATATALSYWLSLNRENAYWTQDKFPWLVRTLGPYLGLPVDPKTGELNREVLGPRDVRDMVGEIVELEIRLGDGTVVVSRWRLL